MVGVSDVMINGQRVSNLFGARDEDWHDAKVKPLKSLHSMTKVQDFEPNVDSTINFFLDKVEERFVKSGKPCDISDYLAYCMSITLSVTAGSHVHLANEAFSRLGRNELGDLWNAFRPPGSRKWWQGIPQNLLPLSRLFCSGNDFYLFMMAQRS